MAEVHQFLTSRWPGDGLGLIHMMIQISFEVGQGMYFGGFVSLGWLYLVGWCGPDLTANVFDKIAYLLSVLLMSGGL